jgi:hypothetical protein
MHQLITVNKLARRERMTRKLHAEGAVDNRLSHQDRKELASWSWRSSNRRMEVPRNPGRPGDGDEVDKFDA